MIQRLRGYKNPGDESPSVRPQVNATDEEAGKGFAPWDELAVAEKNMNEIPLRGMDKS